jgi:copper resistance protein D
VTALALCCFAHFMTAMLAFGSSAYLWLYAPERLTLALSPIVRRLTLIASLVALITAIVWLALESDSMADNWNAAVDPDQIGAVLTDTAFGHVWTAHLFLAATLVTVVAFGPRARWAGMTTASGALLASLGLVGHAAMQTGAEGVLHRVNHAVHLLTTGAWIGGLVPFAMCLRAYRRDDLRKDAVRAMTDFSFWGQLNVAAIILTGVVNIALTSHHAPIPAATPYRALLLSKIIVVAIMISLALFNRFVLAPRLKATATALAVLRATSLAEVVLGCVVVALVSVFALLDPGESRAPAALRWVPTSEAWRKGLGSPAHVVSNEWPSPDTLIPVVESLRRTLMVIRNKGAALDA